MHWGPHGRREWFFHMLAKLPIILTFPFQIKTKSRLVCLKKGSPLAKNVYPISHEMHTVICYLVTKRKTSVEIFNEVKPVSISAKKFKNAISAKILMASVF